MSFILGTCLSLLAWFSGVIGSICWIIESDLCSKSVFVKLLIAGPLSTTLMIYRCKWLILITWKPDAIRSPSRTMGNRGLLAVLTSVVIRAGIVCIHVMLLCGWFLVDVLRFWLGIVVFDSRQVFCRTQLNHGWGVCFCLDRRFA